ncbi:MAG: flagellar basal body L-ring protein FlgH [bacterium]
MHGRSTTTARLTAVALAAVLAGSGVPWSAAPAAADELYRPGQGSLYADPVADRKGDIVIVHLDSTTLQASAGGTSATTSNSPLVSLISSQGQQSTVQSSTVWQHALAGDLAGKVVDVTPEGLLHVRGVRRVQVDGTWQTITIDGFVRQRDLAADDSVQGSHLADVTVTVQGHLSTQQRFGLLDALTLIFGAASLFKFIH